MLPFQLPAPLIHLVGLCRPRLLRPDLRVKSIENVDFRGLRREGFNAVVIDKDNCLTLPEQDQLFPPLKDAWNRLLKAFPPGRVLVVSNSAGTRKDPGGIAAELVALQLQCPVLLHAKPKPACSEDILKYFRGELGPPRTLKGEIKHSADRIVAEERADEQILVNKWLKEIDGPLSGPTKSSPVPKVDPFNAEAIDEKRRKALDDAWNAPSPPRQTPSVPVPAPPAKAEAPSESPLRLLVIGDRLLTDTLLAHRLRLHLGVKDPLTSERVISIHTTQLPQPRDVRILRWIENRLSGSTRLRETSTDWGRFEIREEDHLERRTTNEASAPVGWLSSLREVPPLTLSPSSWKPLPLLFSAGRGIIYAVGFTAWALGRGVRWTWDRLRSRTTQAKEVVVEEIKQEQKLNASP